MVLKLFLNECVHPCCQILKVKHGTTIITLRQNSKAHTGNVLGKVNSR